MPASDTTIRRLETQLDEQYTLVQTLMERSNEGDGRDLTAQELEMANHARERMQTISEQLSAAKELESIAANSRQRAKQLDEAIRTARNGIGPADVQYRSAAEYIADLYLSSMGGDEASTRLQVFHRAAAHQTTADNPGLLPESIVAPVLNYVDNARPLVSAIGTTDLGSGSWAYAKVTQHTQVAVQSAEKAELASRKMTITKTSITAPTYGGYVNVSKQDISRTSPQILDMVIADLASEYAIQTEAAAAADLLAGATAGTALDATPSAEEISAALWAAAATAYTNTKGQGRLILAVAPGDLGLFGRLFAPYNPTNSFGSGFSAGSFGSGAMGAISGITVVMTPGLAAGQALVISTGGVRLFEMRYGALQVNEPSVWGVQVGYAGDFETAIVQTGSIISIDTAP